MSAPGETRTTAWPAAARLLARWLDRRERVDELLESLGGSLTGTERARCQHLVFGAIRHFGRIDAAIGRLVSHSPRFATRAVLLVAGFELIEAHTERGGARTSASEAGTTNAPDQPTAADDGRVAKIVHHAVEQTKQLASPAEARMVNAVVRKLAGVLAEPPPPKLATAEVLAEYFSHPVWLVRSWLAQFGAAATRALLEWNQQPAPVYARWRSSSAEPTEDRSSCAEAAKGEAKAEGAPRCTPTGSENGPRVQGAGSEEPVPTWFKPTAWAGFFEIPPGHWAEIEPLLQSGRIYLQDPATRIPVELLAPAAGELVLDGCAAPGGKSLLIADTMRQGRLVAMDLPGARIGRLKENLARVPAGVEVALVQGDLRQDPAGLLREHKLPAQFSAILLDVPCSNTGVMRHRVDVKWRLQEGDFRKHPRQQLALLWAAARLVAPGGRLVYSTCSIDTEENEHVVQEFLAVAASQLSPADLTWRAGVDVLSFGGTKNGMQTAEAVVFFNHDLARDFEYRVKQGGQLASKMRYVGGQWIAMLRDGAWLRHAAHANAMARRLADAIRQIPSLRFIVEPQVNALFVEMPPAVYAALTARGWQFYRFIGENGYRLMCSWATTEADVDAFVADLRAAAG